MENKQIPQEVFERFAMQYWKQDVLRYEGDLLERERKVLERLVQFPDAYLELKDLADITDEDAIEVFIIFKGYIPEGIVSKVKKNSSGEVFKQFYIPSILDPGEYQVFANFCDDGTIHTLQSNRDTDYWHAADFLRSRSYLLPYSGYSAQDWIDSGRVKIKAINP